MRPSHSTSSEVFRVELARRAVQNLDRLIATHSLPEDTRERVRRSLRPLERFPHLGHELTDRWSDHRVLLGPWRWMLLVYRLDESNDRVVVVTVQDARASTAVARGR